MADLVAYDVATGARQRALRVLAEELRSRRMLHEAQALETAAAELDAEANATQPQLRPLREAVRLPNPLYHLHAPGLGEVWKLVHPDAGRVLSACGRILHPLRFADLPDGVTCTACQAALAEARRFRPRTDAAAASVLRQG